MFGVINHEKVGLHRRNCCGGALADQISVPNEFVAGQTARASEVNENFKVLADESNSQDARIGAVEAALQAGDISDQLICRPFWDLLIQNATLDRLTQRVTCIRASAPTFQVTPNYQEIVSAGYYVTSMNDNYWVFSKTGAP